MMWLTFLKFLSVLVPNKYIYSVGISTV